MDTITIEKLKEDIKTMVVQRPGASFVELERIPNFSGDRMWLFKNSDKKKGFLFWYGISHEAISAIQQLCKNKDIVAQSTPIVVYLCDGKLMRSFVEDGISYDFFPITFSLPHYISDKKHKKVSELVTNVLSNNCKLE